MNSQEKSTSFLKEIIGKKFYESNKRWSIIIALGGGLTLVITVVLAHMFYSEFYSRYIIAPLLGTSLVFIFYVACVIMALDFTVEEKDYYDYEDFSFNDHYKPIHSYKYKITIFWDILLLVLGIVAIYFTNRFRREYIFECSTYFVEESTGLYHSELFLEDCDKIRDGDDLIKMKGYEIEKKGYELCPSCADGLEDYEETAVESQARRP